MSETREPAIRELVYLLVEQAPPPPSFPDGAEPRRPRLWRSAVATAVVLTLVVGSLVIFTTRDDGDDAGSGDIEVGAPSALPMPIAWADETGVWKVEGNGEPERLADGSACCVAWSADGEMLAYLRGRALWIDSGDHDQAMHAEAWRFAWSPRDPLVAALVTEQEHSYLQVYRPNGGLQWAAPTAGSDVRDFAWSPDGNQLAFATTDTHDHVFVARDIAGSQVPEVREVPVQQLLDVDYGLHLAGWSPDGSRILAWVAGNHSGSAAMDGLPLVAIDVATGAATRLFDDAPVHRASLQWSPDGQTLLSHTVNSRMVTDPRHLIACTIDAGCTQPPTTGQTTDPAWSPAGDRYAFVANPASSDPSDFVHDGEPDWTPRYAQRELWIANGDGTGAARIDEAGSGVAMPRFVDDDTILFVRDARMWRLDLASGEPVALTPEVKVAEPPPAAVYDPTDLIGTPWDQIFAIALAPTAPAPPVLPTKCDPTALMWAWAPAGWTRRLQLGSGGRGSEQGWHLAGAEPGQFLDVLDSRAFVPGPQGSVGAGLLGLQADLYAVEDGWAIYTTGAQALLGCEELLLLGYGIDETTMRRMAAGATTYLGARELAHPGALTWLQVSHLDGYDRVELEFAGTVDTEPLVEMSDRPPNAGESDQLADVAGTRYLNVSVSADTQPTGFFDQWLGVPRHANDPAATFVEEAVVTYAFEGMARVTIGLREGDVDYVVSVDESGSRIVVDVHPAPGS